MALGMYKFNYLSGKDGYDVDGNKIPLTKIENSEIVQEKINLDESEKKTSFK
jgi:hypothetical protein